MICAHIHLRAWHFTCRQPVQTECYYVGWCIIRFWMYTPYQKMQQIYLYSRKEMYKRSSYRRYGNRGVSLIQIIYRIQQDLFTVCFDWVESPFQFNSAYIGYMQLFFFVFMGLFSACINWLLPFWLLSNVDR